MNGSPRGILATALVVLVAYLPVRTRAADENARTVTQTWQEAVAHARFDGLSVEMQDKLALTLADAIGVIVYTGRSDEAARFVRASGELAPGAATELVRGSRVDAACAAAINALLIHGHEIDDSNLRNQLRASCVAIPPVLAVAEAEHASGEEFLLALAISYHLADRVATALNRQPAGRLHVRGWMPSAVAGPLGAAAGAARLAKLSPESFVSSLGLAAGGAGGLFQYYEDGTDEKKIHVARAGRVAVESVRLAQAGFRGAPRAIEGRAGLLAALGFERDAEPLVAELERWDSILWVKPKFFACSQGVIPWLEALRSARNRLPALDAIRRIELHVDLPNDSFYVKKINAYRAPTSVLDAQLNVNFGVALLLSRGDAFVDEFTSGAISDPAIDALARRIVAVGDSRRHGTILLHTADRTIEIEGDPRTTDQPYRAVMADYRHKFDRLTDAHVDEAGREALWNHVIAVRKAPDVSAWMARLVELMRLGADS